MSSYGIQVDRPYTPTAIEISDDPKQLEDPEAYPVKVNAAVRLLLPRVTIIFQVTLKSLENENVEVVRAKYVVGCDGRSQSAVPSKVHV